MSRTPSNATPQDCPPPGRDPGGTATVQGGEQFNWEALVPLVVHPLKVAIVEALLWVGRPLTATELAKLVGDQKFTVSHVSYHLTGLAKLAVTEIVKEIRVRGTTAKFYRLR